MIGIQLDGEDDFIETFPDTTISMKLENPLFGDVEKLSPGSYSLPFDLPSGNVSPKNAARLKNPDVIENNEAYQIQKAKLFVSDMSHSPVFFKAGNLKAGSNAGGRTPSYFTFGLNSISADFKKARLRDVIAEGFLIDGNSAVQKKIYIKYNGAGDPTLTINGQKYTGVDLGDIRTQVQNDYNASLDTFQYVPYAVHHLSGSSPGGLAAPYLEITLSLRYTYHDDFLDMDFWLDQFSTDPLHPLSVDTDDLDNIDDYETESFDMTDYYDGIDAFLQPYYSGPLPNNKIRFPVCFNANSYGEKIKDGDLINGINASGLIRNEPNVDDFKIRNVNSLQPFIKVKHILDKIATAFGFELEGDFYEHVDTAKMMLWNTASLDVPLLYIGPIKYVFFRRSFNLSELVPDITVVEFLKSLASRYNLGIYYNESTRKVRMKMREQVAISNRFQNITPMCSPSTGNDDMRVLGYRSHCKKESTDAFSRDESVQLGEGQQPIEVFAGRLFSSSGAFVEAEKYVTGPWVSQKNGDEFGVRIFYDMSIINMGTFSYQTASITGTEINEILANLVDDFWLYWLMFTANRRSVTLNVSFPLRMLLEFDWELKRMFDRSNYLVKAIDLKITNRGIGVTSVELYTMR